MVSVIQSIEEAALAAPANDAENMLREAARCCADLLESGHSLPLPLLLDCACMLRLPAASRPALRPGHRHPPYERWLERLAAGARQRLSDGPRNSGTRALVLDEVAQLLANHFDAAPSDRELLAALRRIAGGEVRDAVQCWRGHRRPAAWAERLPDLDLSGETAMAAAMRSRMARVDGSAWLEEELDHEAARQYLHGTPLRPSPQQMARIWRLRRRRPLRERNPHPEAHEEQSLCDGAITASTLAYGEYGEFLIANAMDIRLSNPPRVRPPPPVELHLVWLQGPSSLSRLVQAPSFPACKETASISCPARSVLQVLAAWLIDDWRSLLRGAMVRFHVHRGASDHDGVTWLPGTRWQPPRPDGHPPPTTVVDRFFRRAVWLDLDPQRIGIGGSSSGRTWWCVIVAKEDEDYFGIHASVDAGVRAKQAHRGSVQAGERRDDIGLPESVASLVVLDARERSGSARAIHRGAIDRAMTASRPTPSNDPSLLGLRARCLDLVLDAVEQRM